MDNTVLLHKSSIYRENNFIHVGYFKKTPLYMGIDKISFVSELEPSIECWEIYNKLDFLLTSKSKIFMVDKCDDNNYATCIKISMKEKPYIYLLISYNFYRNHNKPNIRFELSPQYMEVDSIYCILEWLKSEIGEMTVNNILKNPRVTRMDLTIDIYSCKFIENYYFSISKARTGIRFLKNKDDCKNNYAVGSYRSNYYLLVYEKRKLYSLPEYRENLILVKEKDIEQRITRLELRIKPKNKDKKFFLSKLSKLENPFRIVNVYSGKLVRNNLCDFLPFLQSTRSLPVAIDHYLAEKEGSSRYNRYALNQILDKAISKFALDIDWSKWQYIVKILEPFYK